MWSVVVFGGGGGGSEHALLALRLSSKFMEDENDPKRKLTQLNIKKANNLKVKIPPNRYLPPKNFSKE